MESILRSKLKQGQFGGLSAQRSKIMRSVKARGNRSTELRFRAGLIRRGIVGWKIHPQNIIGRPDFFFPSKRLVVFLDGCFWHGCQRCGHIPKNNRAFWHTKITRNCSRDIAITQQIEAEGITVLRFWEHQLKEDLSSCLREIERYLTLKC